MAFTLNSIIKIGKYAFAGGVNDLVIKKNVHVIVDTATLKIPGLGRIVAVNDAVNAALNVIGLGTQPQVKNLPFRRRGNTIN